MPVTGSKCDDSSIVRALSEDKQSCSDCLQYGARGAGGKFVRCDGVRCQRADVPHVCELQSCAVGRPLCPHAAAATAAATAVAAIPATAGAAGAAGAAADGADALHE